MNAINSALSGLMLARTGMSVANNNIANANTPGYARESVRMQAAQAQMLGGFFVGNGVSPNGVAASSDAYLDKRMMSAGAESAAKGTLATWLSSLENRAPLADLAASMTSFQGALNAAAADPSSAAARTTLLSGAQAFAGVANEAASQFDQAKGELQGSIASTVDQANGLLKSLAEINQGIRSAEAASGGSPLAGSKANDLRANRLAVADQLSNLIGAKISFADDGQSLFAGGALLAAPGMTGQLKAGPSPEDPSKMAVSVAGFGGSSMRIPDGQWGGALSGLLSAQSLAGGYQAQLDQWVGAAAEAVNGQLRLGVDANGSQGGDLFSVNPAKALSSAGNAGTAQLSASRTSFVSGSGYELGFDGSAWSLRSTASGSVVASSATMPISAEGLRIDLSAGSAAAGDSWSIEPYSGAAGNLKVAAQDPKALALGQRMQAAFQPGEAAKAQVQTVDPSAGGFGQAFSIGFSAVSVTITGPGAASQTAPWSPGSKIQVAGVEVEVSGTPAAGSTLTVGPSGGGAADNRNALKVADLLASKSFAGSSWSDLAAAGRSKMGSDAARAKTESSVSTALAQTARNERESFSGVNLDEEAASLMKWQEQYAANAKALAISQSLFKTLLDQM